MDALWHSEVPDFYQLKKEGAWEKYVSPEAAAVQSTVKDPDGFFTPARLGTLGIAYNTKKITAAPKAGATCSIRASRTASPSPTRPCRARP